MLAPDQQNRSAGDTLWLRRDGEACVGITVVTRLRLCPGIDI